MNQYLLDTHTFIWFIENDTRLSQKAKKTIEDDNSESHISIASLREIAIKISLEKLDLKIPFQDVFSLAELNGFELLPINYKDTITVSTLPFHHKNPFDRLIVAQAVNKNFTVISRDEHISLYEIKTLW